MRKVFFLLFFCPFFINAQKDTIIQRPFAIELGINAITLPVGSFGNTESGGGYASKQIKSTFLDNASVFLELRYSPKKPIVTNIFGLKSTTVFAARVSAFAIGFDTESFDKNLNNNVPGIVFQSDAKDYRAINFMVGVYDLYNITKKKRKLFLYDRIYLGLTSAILPALSTSVNGVKQIQRNSASATAFSVQYGIGVYKTFSRKFSTAFGIDYFYTKPIFKNVKTETVNGTSTFNNVITPISILTVMSISFNFAL